MSGKMKKQKDALCQVMFAKGKLRTLIKKYSAYDFARDKKFDNSKQIFEWITENLYIIAEVSDLSSLFKMHIIL